MTLSGVFPAFERPAHWNKRRLLYYYFAETNGAALGTESVRRRGNANRLALSQAIEISERGATG